MSLVTRATLNTLQEDVPYPPRETFPTLLWNYVSRETIAVEGTTSQTSERNNLQPSPKATTPQARAPVQNNFFFFLLKTLKHRGRGDVCSAVDACAPDQHSHILWKNVLF